MGIRHLRVMSLVLVGCLCSGQLLAQAPSGITAPASAAATPPMMVASTAPSVVPPSAIERGLAQAEQVLKVLAYLVGGAWVYFNYFRGRTHRPRLETRVTCEQLRSEAPVLLRVGASAKNTGLSKVDITDKGSAAVIYGYDLASGEWKTLQAHSMLTKEHHWIEPGECILDELLVRVDAPYAAFRVELWLNSTSKVTWVARTISGPLERNDHGTARTGERAGVAGRSVATTATTDAAAPTAAADAAAAANRADRRAETANPTTATMPATG